MARTRKQNGSSIVDAETEARICWHHFREGQTQQEVADRVGVNRATVNKVINDARRRGLVRITLDLPASPCLALEKQLVDAFGLRDAVVIPSPKDKGDVRRVVGLAAGQYISGALKENQTLGLGWGATIHGAGQSLLPRNGTGNTVVSLPGGLPESGAINPYDNAATFARLLDAKCYYMTAPLMAETEAVKDALVKSQPIKRIYKIAADIDVALISAVDLSPETRMIDYGVLTKTQVRDLKRAGAVGNICDYYLDADGNVVDHEINRRTLSVPLSTIRKAPHIVLAAGGRYKAKIVCAALCAGLAHTLITDEDAAGVLLRTAPKRS